jgi:hypothetical protein
MTHDLTTPRAGAGTSAIRALLACGVIAGPLFIAVSLLQALTRDGFDLRRQLRMGLAHGGTPTGRPARRPGLSGANQRSRPIATGWQPPCGCWVGGGRRWPRRWSGPTSWVWAAVRSLGPSGDTSGTCGGMSDRRCSLGGRRQAMPGLAGRRRRRSAGRPGRGHRPGQRPAAGVRDRPGAAANTNFKYVAWPDLAGAFDPPLLVDLSVGDPRGSRRAGPGPRPAGGGGRRRPGCRERQRSRQVL